MDTLTTDFVRACTLDELKAKGRIVLHGRHTPAFVSLMRFQASLLRLAAEFEQLARQDARLPLEKRGGCSAVLALRSWEFSEFGKLRRSRRQK